MKQGKKRQYAHETLPQGYELYEVIDLGKDPKLQKRIALSGLAVIAAMIAMALPAHAFKTAISMHPVQITAAALGTLVGFVVYLFLHEGVHGMCIRWFSGVPAEYGFQLKAGMAYAGSRYFFSKSAYIVIAMAPVAVWGTVLAILLRDVPSSYWWYLYAVQIFNVSGAIGDLFVTYRILTMPKDVLVLDTGMEMKFFAPTHFA